ncbi:MAG: hypothetical protein A4E71_02928 [Smithella sp. PtaU1.Bin162]|nr:MAG: hypothetical protein A4E71_02928 [Smithella sp. PtaU1.Bin162]
MTARELILELKKYPPHLEVGISAHDNSEWEIAGWIHTVNLFERKNFKNIINDQMFNDKSYTPDKCIVLRT